MILESIPNTSKTIPPIINELIINLLLTSFHITYKKFTAINITL